uniref:protein-tyrosine-phosphatase n=1 Tax=Lutzomyia longipalpis TaxID=7200 RepID=A0A7G3AVK5_LUTLO
MAGSVRKHPGISMLSPMTVFLAAFLFIISLAAIGCGEEVHSPLVITENNAGQIRKMSLERRQTNSAFEFNYTTTPFSIEFIEEPPVKFIYFNYTRIESNATEFGNNFVMFDPGKKALTGLAPCSLYSVFGEMKNLATNRTFNHTQPIATDYALPVTTISWAIPFGDSIELQWNTSNSDCVAYYHLKVTSGQFNYEVNTTRLDWSLDSLAPCTSYEISIETVNIFRESVGVVKVKEETSFVDPGPVEELHVHSGPDGGLEVAWEAPVDGVECVSDYTVKLSEDSCLDTESCLWRYMNTSKSLKGEFDDVEACTRYTVVVYTNGQEDGANSSLTFDTDFIAPGVLESLNSTILSPSQLKVFWEPPVENAHCIDHYVITFRDQTRNTTDLEIILDDLEPCFTYVVNVFVVDIQGNEGRPLTIEVQMPEDYPGEIPEAHVQATPSELLVSWQRPTYARHCVENYRLQIVGDATHHGDHDHIGTDVSYTFQRMTACRKISVRIYARTATEKESLPKILTTRIPDRVTATPSSPQLVKRTKSSLELKASLTDSFIDCELVKAKFLCISQENEITMEAFDDNIAPLADNFTDFSATIEHLPPYTNFNCSVRVLTSAGWSDAAVASFLTEEDYPGAPMALKIMEISNKGFHVNWLRPLNQNGIVNAYRLEIQQVEPLYLVPSSCPRISLVNFTEETHLYDFVFDRGAPSFVYFVQVAAVNGAGVGVYTRPIVIRTLSDKPDPVSGFAVQSIDGPYTPFLYNATVTIGWTIPCVSNGALEAFEGEFFGTKGEEKHEATWEYVVRGSVRENYTFSYDDLRPEYQYKVTIRARVREIAISSDSTMKEFYSPAGIPDTFGIENWATINVFSSPNPTRSADVAISEKLFNSSAGEIISVALLVSECGCQDDPKPLYGVVESDSCSMAVMRWQEAIDFACIPQYQTTCIRWPPNFEKSEAGEFIFTIGQDDCEDAEGFCNGHLRPNTEYSVVIRTFTRHGFSDSAVMHFRTDALVALAVIIGIVTGCLLVAFIVGLFIAKRSNSLLKWSTDDMMSSDDGVPDVELKKFSDHYIGMMRNSKENLTKEFKLLNAVTMEKDFSMAAAKHNETKNRYVNIVPYDMNRVLLSTEDGETEYINASYITGFKRSKDYIATQGPKLETCYDFWRMCLQCNVKRIVMLTLLREDEKVKCYGYYPMSNMKNRSIQFRDIHIQLESEAEFPIYKKRIFVVKKGDVEKKIAQYHFTKWPDHGCPQNPSDLIEFTRTYQIEKKNSTSPTVVHCSAGVGRTGTFIALDIIMQTLRTRKSINIYEIVRRLRCERMKMVQTFHQYCLLYQCAYILVNKTSSMRWSKKSVLSRRMSRIQQTPSNSSIQSLGREIPTHSAILKAEGHQNGAPNADSVV